MVGFLLPEKEGFIPPSLEIYWCEEQDYWRAPITRDLSETHRVSLRFATPVSSTVLKTSGNG